MTSLRAVVLVGAGLLSPSLARAQSPPPTGRHVVIVAESSTRAAALALAQSLGELVRPYRAEVIVRDAADAPELDAAVTLRLSRAAGGLSVNFELRRIDAARARPSALALRVLTAIRGALESADEDPLAQEEPEATDAGANAPARRVERAPMAVDTVFSTRLAPTQPTRVARRAVRRTLALEAGAGQWSPLGVGVFTGASLRLSGRVGGTARSGAWLGVEAMVLGARTLVLSGVSERVAQWPVLFDGQWVTRYGVLTAALGATFAALVTRVGAQSENATLAFGAGVSLELGVRLGERVTVAARGRGLCLGHTTVVHEDNPAAASIGPFFAAGELVLRIGL